MVKNYFIRDHEKELHAKIDADKDRTLHQYK
jgi:hypothetical protein